MPIEAVEASAWRHLDVARDVIDMERTRRMQALAPGESIAFVDAPQRRYAESAVVSAGEAQSQAMDALQTVEAQQVAAAMQSEPGTLSGVLDLSVTRSSGGASALLPPPTASAQELKIIDLMLANPLNVALIAAFAPDRPVLEGGNSQMLIERYGRERAEAMRQLGQATDVVRDRYAQAVDHALHHPSEDQSWWHPSIDQQALDPGERQHGQQQSEREWEFDAAEFTRWYCEQSGFEHEAFASLYGGRIECAGTHYYSNPANDRARSHETYALGDGQIQLNIVHNGFEGEPRQSWHHGAGLNFGSLVAFNPNDPPRLLDAEAVLFDPTLGFVTPRDNIDYSHGTDIAMVVIAGVVVSVMTAGAASGVVASVTNATGSAAVGAAAGGAIVGFVSSAVTGLITDNLSFKSLLIGTLTGAITAGMAKGANLDTAGLDAAGNVVDYGARVMAITGKATLQGALTELAGGNLLEGFTAGVASGFAAEVTRGLNLEITSALKGQHITETQASVLRTLAQATGSAISALADPDNPGYAIARDFLNTMLSPSGGAVSVESLEDSVELDFDGLIATTSATSEGDTAQADSSQTAGQESTQRHEITERDREGIDQSDEILFRRGDDLAEANGLNPRVLADGRIQCPDGRIRTPGGEAITEPAPDAGPASAYTSQYRHVPATQGVMPVGGFENLTPAPDLPPLPPEATPILADGRHGSGVPYRDQAGQAFYAAYDADGRAVRWLSATPAAAMVSPAAAQAARAILTAEVGSGAWPLAAVAGVTLVGTTWLIAQGRDDIFSREALTPDQVRDGQRGMINVPVSPGRAGTPGYVADGRDTSTPALQPHDLLPPLTTTLPITERSWRDLLVEAGGFWNTINESTDPNVVQQSTPTSCGPACAQMLLGDRGIAVDQSAFGDSLTSAQDLAAELNSVDGGWIGAGVDPSSLVALTRTGSWSAMMWESGARTGHWVVVEGISPEGLVKVRDPFDATRYEMTQSDFVKSWSGYSVFKP
jgi:hypothetical protein